MSQVVSGAVIVSIDDTPPPVVGIDTPDATTSAKGKAVLLGGTADNPTVPYSKVTGTPTIPTIPNSLPPSGPAGGILSGNYPNPGFAVDMATQSELDAVVAGVPDQVFTKLGTSLVAGSNVTITVDEAFGTITITSTGGGGGTGTVEFGTTEGTACEGNDPRLANSRTPTGSAGGVLSGTYPNPGFAVDMATQSELNTGLSGKSDTGHTHDYAPSVHTHAYAASSHTHDYAATSHLHVIGDLPVATSGSSSSTQIVRADDSRLSNARTPTAHTHGVTDLTASGTRDTTTFLRGDNTWAVPAGGGGTVSDATTSSKGIIQLAGDLGGTAAAPTVVRRAPIGGVQTPAYAATVTLNAANGNHARITATGNLTLNAPTNGVDGQRIVVEVQASGAARTVTFPVAFETSQAVPGRVFTVPSGTWGYFVIAYRGTTWRLAHAEPQTLIPPYPSTWTPSDNGLLAWAADPSTVNANLQPASGAFFASLIKLDQTALIGNIICHIVTAGATLTSTRNRLGIYSTLTGNLLGQSNDQSSAWTTTGMKTVPLPSSINLAAGQYLVGGIATGTTVPVFAASAMHPAVANFGRTTSAPRTHYTSTAQTSMPATVPALTSHINLIWFGLS